MRAWKKLFLVWAGVQHFTVKMNIVYETAWAIKWRAMLLAIPSGGMLKRRGCAPNDFCGFPGGDPFSKPLFDRFLLNGRVVGNLERKFGPGGDIKINKRTMYGRISQFPPEMTVDQELPAMPFETGPERTDVRMGRIGGLEFLDEPSSVLAPHAAVETSSDDCGPFPDGDPMFEMDFALVGRIIGPTTF